MARAVLRDIVFGLATTGLLMGCVQGDGSAGTGEKASLAAPPAKKKASGQEVEAPEVFQTTDSALWDGRPSLGGIWVASPDVTDPQRVIMFNPATGKSIAGALFRRERENPGPKLQLSSDAAEALGILAGAPTEISVTALRKEEVAEAPAAEPAADPAATEAAAADPAAKPAKDGDAAAIASAALAAVDAEKTGTDTAATDPAAKDADPAAAVAAGTAAVAAAAADGTAAVVDGTPKKKTWKERRAEAKAAREAKKKAAADAKAAAAAAAAGTAVAVEGAGAGEAPTASPDAAAAAIAPIESAPLDARKPEAVAPVETKKSKRKAAAEAAAAAAAETAAAAPAPAETAVTTGPARPIQVASFSKEDNAKRAAEALAKIGVTATPQKSEKGGKAVWGVVVMGDEAMLKKIKDAGFADAYFLK